MLKFEYSPVIWRDRIYNLYAGEQPYAKYVRGEWRQQTDKSDVWRYATMTEKKMKLDNINRPAWYFNNGKAEIGPYDFCKQQELGIEAFNIIKNVTRAGRKPGDSPLKDLKEARFFLDRLIEHEEMIEDLKTWPAEGEPGHETPVNFTSFTDRRYAQQRDPFKFNNTTFHRRGYDRRKR